MSSHIYKILELTGTSAESIEDAVNRAIATAARTVRNLHWFEVIETRGRIGEGRVQEWQVTIKAGFALET